MRRLLVFVAALSLMVPALAMAQSSSRDHHRGGSHRAAPHRAMPHRATPHRAMPHRVMPRHHEMHRRPGRDHRGEFHYGGRYHPRIHGHRWHYPHGWHYRRWHVGALFPLIFLNPTYYFTDYALFGLAPPPPGFAWVRFGPDLVLVNLHSRHVRRVIYGVFY